VLKLGVTTRRGLGRAETWLGNPRHVSILLLRELAADPASTPEEYDRLTRYARMPNGVWRFTQHGRMRVVDAALMELLRARHAADTTLVVCDLAASTGATSVELYRAVRESFATEFVATDLYRDMIAVRSRHWPAAVVFDARGREVQYVCGPLRPAPRWIGLDRASGEPCARDPSGLLAGCLGRAGRWMPPAPRVSRRSRRWSTAPSRSYACRC
jgi:hypothetical protein